MILPFAFDLDIRGAHSHQVAEHPFFVLDVFFFLAAFHFVERRLGDVDVAVLEQLGHLPVKECEQKRANMAAVDVGVGHQADLVIPKLCDIKIFFADSGSERRDQAP